MYKLNPDLPLVWRTPTSLQFGVNSASCLLTEVSLGAERLISLLNKGISEPSLPLIARECGLSVAKARELLTELEPALRVPPRLPSLRIALDGQGPFIDQLGTLLVQCGHRVVIASARTAGPADLALVVGTFALTPHRTGDWLRRGIPHITICWGDTHVDLSPLLGSAPSAQDDVSRFPCAECLELHHRDKDERWPVIATQVVNLPAASQTPLLKAEVATLLCRWISSPGLIPIDSETGIRIAAQTGEREKVTFALHPECACQAL
ncbi:MAG: hypothetical protein RLZZ52_860, partial [Actinomycetota bacterium]